MYNPICQLILNEFQIPIKIGVSDAERDIEQTVLINITITFSQQPSACISDDIKDTICYDSLCKDIMQFCQHNSFHLLEHLGYQLYQHLLPKISNYGTLWLSITKISPLANLKNSQFNIGQPTLINSEKYK